MHLKHRRAGTERSDPFDSVLGRRRGVERPEEPGTLLAWRIRVLERVPPFHSGFFDGCFGGVVFAPAAEHLGAECDDDDIDPHDVTVIDMEHAVNAPNWRCDGEPLTLRQVLALVRPDHHEDTLDLHRGAIAWCEQHPDVEFASEQAQTLKAELARYNAERARSARAKAGAG